MATACCQRVISHNKKFKCETLRKTIYFSTQRIKQRYTMKTINKTAIQRITRTCIAKIKRKQGLWFMIAGLFFAAFAIHHLLFASTAVAAVKYAILYSFANNGKLSGRADGNVYMRNGRVRGMKIPRLVQNTYTALQRSSFSALNAGWRALSAANQAAWNAATGWSAIDRFGKVVALTGKTLYVTVNRALSNVGGTPLSAPAAQVGTTPPVTFTMNGSLAAGHFKATYTATPVAASNAWLIMATSPRSAGIFRPGKSQYRVVTFLAAAAASPQDKTVAYSNKYGTPVAGQKVFFKVIAVNTATGEQGAAFLGSYTVTA